MDSLGLESVQLRVGATHTWIAIAKHLDREGTPHPPPEQRGLRPKESPGPTIRASGTQDQVNRGSAKIGKCGQEDEQWRNTYKVHVLPQ